MDLSRRYINSAIGWGNFEEKGRKRVKDICSLGRGWQVAYRVLWFYHLLQFTMKKVNQCLISSGFYIGVSNKQYTGIFFKYHVGWKERRQADNHDRFTIAVIFGKTNPTSPHEFKHEPLKIRTHITTHQTTCRLLLCT